MVSVPLVLHTVGPERYGVWLSISSLVAFLWVADFGVSRGLVTVFASALGQNDRERASAIVSSAFFTLGGLGLGVGLLLLAVFWFVPWCKLLNVTTPLAQAEVPLTIGIVLVCWLAEWIGRIVPRIQEGMQAGYWNHIWSAAARLLSLAALVVAARSSAGLPLLALALAGVPTLGNLLNAAVLLRTNPELLPRWSRFRRDLSGEVLRGGLGFLGLDLSYVVIFNGCYLVVANVLGPAAVAEFGVPARAFAVVNMLVSVLVVPLWPAYAESLARGDFDWIRKAFGRSMWLTLAASVLPSAVLVLFGRQLVALWVGDAVKPTALLLVSFGAWNIVTALGNATGVFLNGTGAVRSSAVTQITAAIVVVPLELLVAPRLGLVGVLWVMTVTDLCFRIAMRLALIRGILRRSPSRHPHSDAE